MSATWRLLSRWFSRNFSFLIPSLRIDLFAPQGFLQPLRNVGACSQDIPVIFGNIELLYSVNTDLLAKLNTIFEEETENDEFLVGQIFCDMVRKEQPRNLSQREHWNSEWTGK